MIRCVDCKYLKFIDTYPFGGYFCMVEIARKLKEEQVLQPSRSFMCDLYSPLPEKELELFKKEE